MKKISIITIIDNNNFGTFLQAFSLCKCIEALGAQPEIVDYCRPSLNWKKNLKKSLSSTINPIRLLVRFYTALQGHRLHLKDRKFIKEYLTPVEYSSFEEIKKNPPVADIYMTGSDQVWNSIYNRGVDHSFYLDYAPHGSKKVAYAASFGMDEIPENECDEIYALLSEYSHISLREESSVRLLIDLNLPSFKLQTVLDPTLLLSKEEWFSHIKIPRMHKEKYLLVYSVESKAQDKIISEYAKKISLDKGLIVVGVYYGSKYNRIQSCKYNHYRATPQSFLSLMYYADYVIVSSFHGTAFSINFEKEFLTITPNRFNNRVSNLLKITGLEERLITSLDDKKLSLSEINYELVRKNLQVEREKSKKYLQSIIFD